MDALYHSYAKAIGISDASFWILYSVREHNGAYTQKELSSDWSYVPQTVNSALKTLQDRGLVALEPVPNNRKNKQILLTEEGNALVKATIEPLMLAEQQSLLRFQEQERSQFLTLTQKYVLFLREEITNIRKSSSEDLSSQ